MISPKIQKQQDIGGVTSMASSNASSSRDSSIRERMVNAKHFTEDTRLQEVIQLYSSLEERDDADFLLGTNNGAIKRKHSNSTSGIANNQAEWNFKKQNRNCFQKLSATFIKKLFMINTVILDYQAVTPLIYHGFLLFECLQILFFVFYKIQIVNEFRVPSFLGFNNDGGKSSNSSSSSSDTQDLTVDDLFETFQLDQYLLFSNFQLYPLLNMSENQYMVFFIVATAILMLFISVALTTAERLFKALCNEDIKDGTRLMIRVFSIILTAFIFVLQIPMMTTYFQGYHCDEDPEDVYILEADCHSGMHLTMIALSTIFLVVYCFFLMIEQVLFSSNNFDTSLPWGSLKRNVPLLKVILKLVISANFTFNKIAQSQGIFHILCFFLNLVVLYKRATAAFFFDKKVQNACIIYETLQTWLFLSVGCHILSETDLTISSLTLLTVIGLLVGYFIVLYQNISSQKVMMKQNPLTQLKTSDQFHIFFLRMKELLNVFGQAELLALEGIFSTHLSNCLDDKCRCSEIADSITGIKSYKKFKKQIEEDKKRDKEYGKEDESAISSINNDLHMGYQAHSSNDYAKSHKYQGSQLQKMSLKYKKNPLSIFNTSKASTVKAQPLQHESDETPPSTSIQNYSAINPKGDANSSSPDTTFQIPLIVTSKARGTLPPEHIFERENSFNSLTFRGKVDVIVPQEFKDVQEIQITESNRTNVKQSQHSTRNAYNNIQSSAAVSADWSDSAEDLLSEYFKVHLNTENGDYRSFDYSKDHIEQIKKQFYYLMTLFVNEAIIRFPKNIDFHILNSHIQRTRLNNEFKAIFEIMNCETYNPSFQDRFVLFRRKFVIEQALLKRHERNALDTNAINIKQAYLYEKQFLKYALLEYMTANSALKFWRELLQKQINASALQMRGAEISKNYEQIQDIYKELLKLYPNDIKFLYRYGTFLYKIVNNEYDGTSFLEKAHHIYQLKISKKAASVPINEQYMFGENSAAAIVVVSATSEEVGIIEHANDEIGYILGYQRREIIGKNCSVIMPKPLGDAHNHFIKRYFETAKSIMIDNQVQHFAVCSDGYLKHVKMLIKVYPHLTDKLRFVAFIQASEKFDSMNAPQSQFEIFDQQYIMCDKKGNISNVTDGLNFEIGFNSKFFNYSSTAHQNQISLQVICPDILDKDIQDMLETEGHLLMLDTREILNLVELEKLSSEEILEVRSRIGLHQAYVQLKKIVYDSEMCEIHIYRVVIIPDDEASLMVRKWNDRQSGKLQVGETLKTDEMSRHLTSNESGRSGPGNIIEGSQEDEEFDLSSMESGSSPSYTFNKMIRDFKKVLAERKTPGNLLILNKVIFFIVLITMALSCIDFALKQTFVDDLSHMSEHSMQTQIRSVQLIQLASNLRSLIDTANDAEFTEYEGTNLKKINRFSYLEHLVQSQASDLQMTLDFMTSLRIDAHHDKIKEQSDFEYETIELLRLDQQKTVSQYSLPYRVALNSYLSQVLMLNGTKQEDMLISNDLLPANPTYTSHKAFKETATSQERNLFFILINGLRSLREKTIEAVEFRKEREFNNYSLNVAFLSIMIIGSVVSLVSVVIVLYSIWITEKNKADTLSLYAILKIPQIKRVYDKCDAYLDTLLYNGKSMRSSEHHNELINQDFHQQVALITAGNDQDEGEISEEEKEEREFASYLHLQKVNRKRELARKARKKEALQFQGHEYYGDMIKQALTHLKSINEHIEEKENSKKIYIQQNEVSQQDISLADVSSSREFLDESTESQLRQHRRKNNQVHNQRSLSGGVKKSKEPQNSLSHSNSSEEDNVDDHNRHKRNRKVKRAEDKEQQQSANDNNLKQEELEHRKQLFFKTVKSKNWRFLMANAIVGLVFCLYFIYGFVFHSYQNRQLSIIKEKSPVFFDRYSNMLLTYSFMRERILNNNSLATFTPDNIDEIYNQMSLSNEASIKTLKVQQPKVLKPMLDFEIVADSEGFCTDIIGQFKGGVEEKVSVSRNAQKKLKEIRRKAYQNLINTVIAACNAASAGDLELLKSIKAQGVDLNLGDYDNRTPLHVSTGAGHIHIVKYLIEEAYVIISPVDRWGATPLCDAQPFPEIKRLLLEHGAILGKLQPAYTPYQVQVTDDQFRLYYAAFYGDVAMMENLRLLGWNVNGQDYDGRTAIGVAASEGQLEAVKYLVSKGADLSIKDGRGNDALGDAIRQNRTATIEYLNSIINESLIRDFCSSFYDGLLKKGVQQMLGIFHKKFSDVQITVNQSSYQSRPNLLKANAYSSNQSQNLSQTTLSAFQMFQTTQELYLHKVINKFLKSVEETFSRFSDDYTSTTQITFIIFLALQLIILVYMRSKLIEIMREDVFQSRGILNLIPEDFFDDNKDSVQKLIKKLKD